MWTFENHTTRRNFLGHLSWGGAILSGSAATLTCPLPLHAARQGRGKSMILIWLGGGPSTIDLWDLKPGSATGGPFQPIRTTGEGQICEHLPQLAEQMRHLSVVRTMSTREADHTRAKYYLLTGFVPDATTQHPSIGAVVSKEQSSRNTQLKLPPFVSIGGGAIGAGYLGSAFAPFGVSSDGHIENLEQDRSPERFDRRMSLLRSISNRFTAQHPGGAAADHTQLVDKTLALISSDQRRAFRIDQESNSVRSRYGDSDFGRGCLMARRLVETGVPFVEVGFNGWDDHTNIFATLKDDRLPVFDRAFSGLVEDLALRGLWNETVVLCLGEFGRTPRINSNGGRDHYARAWSVVLGGGGLAGGKVIGATSSDGTRVESEPYSSEDLLATVCHAMDISLDTKYTSRTGRPMKIVNGGTAISSLLL